MDDLQIPKDLCKQVLKVDKAIRFAAINDKFGKTVMIEYRKGVVPLLSKEEASLSLIQSTISMGSKRVMQSKLGSIVYASILYEKVKQATVPLSDHSFLFVLFDKKLTMNL